MSREERRKLLFAPITFGVYGGSTWGGSLSPANPDMSQAEYRQWLRWHRVPDTDLEGED
jgi:predicted alpha/beta hydrolase